MSPPNPERRSERARRAILDAARELGREQGYAQMTIEAIARRAGVGKQTIYRWWPSKGAVAFDALDETVGAVADFPDTGDVVADLHEQMTGVVQLFTTEDFAGPYTGLIAAAQSDPDLRQRLDEMLGVRVAACRKRLERARDDGQIRADANLDDVVELLYAPLYYRLLLHTRPLTPAQVTHILDLAFTGLHPEPPE